MGFATVWAGGYSFITGYGYVAMADVWIWCSGLVVLYL